MMPFTNPTRASEKLVAKLKLIENYTPVARHLPGDRANVITGGYGETQVTLGETHTEAEWDGRLRRRLQPFERAIVRAVQVRLTQSQFDALVLFAYNVGLGDPHCFPPIAGLLTSTLLDKLNMGDYVGAAAEFGRWTKANGQVLPGLVTRRATEASLFREGIDAATLAAA